MSILNGLKICFISGTLGQGGAERQLFYQLQTLQKHGAQATVVCFSKGEYWRKPIERLGIPVIELNQACSQLGRLARMLTIMREITPDIVQSTHFYTNLYAVLSARLLKIREIGAVRSDGVRDVVETGSVAGQLSLRLPRVLAINSHNAVRNIVRMGGKPSKLRYFPNVVDTDAFGPSDSPFKDEFHIVMVGRLAEVKRFDLFLKLLSRLHKTKNQKCIGHIVGSGPNLKKLQDLVMSLGLGPEQVRFHGAVADVQRIYHSVDLSLHLSDWEGMPNTILEAMACGLPIIATRVGGIPELVQDRETGFLIEPGDESTLLLRTVQIIDDRDLRADFGRRAREFVEKHHALSILPIVLEEFYKDILD